jgi:hypothetical protein
MAFVNKGKEEGPGIRLGPELKPAWHWEMHRGSCGSWGKYR